ncbi:MAG: bacterial Ig-like domain-containing protein, partial [Clostridia bacterium]|nr:bacterial Ig-like domain-containing protein [Clostridia bacterium]
LILNAGRDGVVGVKGFDIEVSYPENAKGFDNRIFAAFFSKVTKTKVIADDNARSFIAISRKIPFDYEIYALKASDNADWNKFREVMTKARNAYDNVSESQRVFLSGADKFIASEEAMREKAATFGETLKKVSITVSQKPDKTEYVTGETFDSKGLKLVLLWSDGSKEELDGGFNIENKNRPLTQSNRTVRITYEGLYTTLNVTVGDPAVEKVEVKTQPTKLNYEVGDKFQTAGLTLLVTFVNGDTKTIYSPKEYTIEQGEFAEGDNIVKITYGGKTVEITVHVGENKPDPKPGESDSSTDSSSDTDSTITSGSDASSSTKNKVGLIVGVSVGAVVVLAGVAAAVILILKKRKIM